MAKVARALGATGTIELPEAGRARAAAYVITAAERAALHLDRLSGRAAEFDPAVRDRLIAGSAIPASWVIKAQRLRRWYNERVLQLLDDVDIILAPTTPCRAPNICETTFVVDGVTMAVRPNIGVFTQPISFIGLPVVAAPVWIDGVQVIAAPWKEAHASLSRTSWIVKGARRVPLIEILNRCIDRGAVFNPRSIALTRILIWYLALQRRS